MRCTGLFKRRAGLIGRAAVAAAVLSAGMNAHATVLQISDAAYSGSYTAGTPENITGAANILSLTSTDGTYSQLIGATANNVVSTNMVNSVTTPAATLNAAVTGLTAQDGVNNLQSGNFQFGTTFTASTRFFIVESTPQSSTPGDPTTVQLIDANNAVISTYALTLSPSDFTTSAGGTTSTSLATLTYATGQGTLTAKLGGVEFSLADFTGGTGSLAAAVGIRLTSPGAAGGTNILDPNVVAVTPEPTSLSALVVVGGALLRRRRRTVA